MPEMRRISLTGYRVSAPPKGTRLFARADATTDRVQIDCAHTATADAKPSADDEIERARVISGPTGQFVGAQIGDAGLAEITRQCALSTDLLLSPHPAAARAPLRLGHIALR